MNVIRKVKRIEPLHPNGKTILYMMGYGGRMWQSTLQLRLLRQEGYQLVVLDFIDILKHHDPADLITLMDEVAELAEVEGLISKDTTIVGISLGGLVGYNLLRRYPTLDKLLIITGGDVVNIPRIFTFRKRWNIPQAELAEYWRPVNMYSEVGSVHDKRVVMLLPKRDRVIDAEEVVQELAKHAHLNDITIIPTPGGHFRTIISQTIIKPRQSLTLIKELAAGKAGS